MLANQVLATSYLCCLRLQQEHRRDCLTQKGVVSSSRRACLACSLQGSSDCFKSSNRRLWSRAILTKLRSFSREKYPNVIVLNRIQFKGLGMFEPSVEHSWIYCYNNLAKIHVQSSNFDKSYFPYFSKLMCQRIKQQMKNENTTNKFACTCIGSNKIYPGYTTMVDVIQEWLVVNVLPTKTIFCRL